MVSLFNEPFFQIKNGYDKNNDPYNDNNRPRDPILWFAPAKSCFGFLPAFLQNLGRNQSDNQRNAEGDDHKIIQITQNRDGIGYQVYRA